MNHTIPVHITIPQGWQCPKCLNIYSPNTHMCYQCSNLNNKVTNSVGVDFDPNTLTHGTTKFVFPDNPLEGNSSNTVNIKQSENFPY